MKALRKSFESVRARSFEVVRGRGRVSVRTVVGEVVRVHGRASAQMTQVGDSGPGEVLNGCTVNDSLVETW